jgi:hypothetical protein
MLAIRLPEDVERRLDSIARRTGRTKTFYAREAILVHLRDLEDAYRGGKTRSPAAQVPKQVPDSAGSPSFISRWKGRFRPAGKADERYQSLAKKYL